MTRKSINRMTIIQDGSNRAYTKISNSLLQDTRVTHETKGLICELLSRPLDWEITVRGIMATGKSGRDKVYRMIDEAKTFGYLKPDRERRPDGKYEANRYIVTDLVWPEEAHDLPLPENPEVDERPLPGRPYPARPDTANPPQQRKESNKEKKEQTNAHFDFVDEGQAGLDLTGGDDPNGTPPARTGAKRYETSFAEFWRQYPNKLGKAKGSDLWKTLTPTQRALAVRHLPDYLASKPVRDGYPKQGDTYIQDRVWESFIPDPAEERDEQVKRLALDLAFGVLETGILERAAQWWTTLADVPGEIIEAAKRFSAENGLRPVPMPKFAKLEVAS
jgi:hypothetical protein